MKKIKNSQLFVVSLVLGIVFCLPAAFAKAENVKQNSANNGQVKVSENQDGNDQEGDDIDDGQKDNNKGKQEGDVDKDKKDNDNEQEDDNQLNGEEHKSIVAISVQNLLKVADKEQGEIGDKIKEIANEQNSNKENVANEIDKIKNRSGFKKFFIGTDYKNLGQLRSEMVKTNNQIDELKGLLDLTTNAESKVAIQAQIQVLEKEQQKIGDFLKTNESKFSLFGWFVKLVS